MKKDPLLGKLAMAVKEEKDAKGLLQAQLSKSQDAKGQIKEINETAEET